MNVFDTSVKIVRCSRGLLVTMRAQDTETGAWALDLFVDIMAACCKKSNQFARFADCKPLHKPEISMLFQRHEEIAEFFKFLRSEIARHDIQLTE